MKKNPVVSVLSIVLVATCLVCMLSLFACSSEESSMSEEIAPEDPKYTVQLFVDCEQNLIFSRYDVDVIVDGDEVGNIEHGSEATFELSLTKGQHELKFEREGDSEPDGRTAFIVGDEGDKLSYEIKCTSDQIEIESIRDEGEDQSDNDATEEGDSEEQEPAEEDVTKEEKPAQKDPEEPETHTTENEVDSTPKEEAKPSKYEYALVRRMSNYDLYYLIDLDEMTATYFGTNDSGSMVLPCSGDLDKGLTIDYGDEGFVEHLQYKKQGDDSVVVLIDANGFDWEYEKTDIAEAEAVLASVS